MGIAFNQIFSSGISIFRWTILFARCFRKIFMDYIRLFIDIRTGTTFEHPCYIGWFTVSLGDIVFGFFLPRIKIDLHEGFLRFCRSAEKSSKYFAASFFAGNGGILDK